MARRLFLSWFFACAILWSNSFAQAQFELVITPLDGTREISLGALLSLTREGMPTTGSSTKVVEVTVNTALNQRYEVVHVLQGNLQNAMGGTIPKDALTFFVSGGTAGAIPAATSPTSIGEGETLLFTSNANGDSDRFLVYYTINIPPEQGAGDYNASILFKVRTLQ